jgi:hypothetical protein
LSFEAKAQSDKQQNSMPTMRASGHRPMYENMKPKDAAKVFDRQEMPVLIEIAAQINPRRCRTSWARCSPTLPSG